jgi:hypothetical protein
VAAFQSLDQDEQQAILTACASVLGSPGGFEPGMVALCKLLQATAMR